MNYTTLILNVAALLACSAASAVTIHVPDPDLGITHPSQAIAIAQPGDEIEISGTSYYSPSLVVSVSDITIRGAVGPPVQLRGEGGEFGGSIGPGALTISGASGVVLENLQLIGGQGGTEGGTPSSSRGANGGTGLWCENASVRLSRCDLVGGNGGRGSDISQPPFYHPSHGFGGPGLAAFHSEVVFSDSTSAGGYYGGGGGIPACPYYLSDESNTLLLGTTPTPPDRPTCIEAGSQLLDHPDGDAWILSWRASPCSVSNGIWTNSRRIPAPPFAPPQFPSHLSS